MQCFLLKQSNAVFFADADCFLIPDARLYFAYMSAAHKQHTKSGLTDTATDCERKFVIQKHFVERKFSAVITVCGIKLICKRMRVNNAEAPPTKVLPIKVFL